jgi:hypothetical protein
MKLQEASENIKRLSVMFKGLIEAADEIDKLGSLENHVKELEIKKVTLIKECDTLSKDNDVIIESINSNNQRASDVLKDAESKALEITKDAQKIAEDKITKSAADANNIHASLLNKNKEVEALLKKDIAQLAFVKSQILEESKKLEVIQTQLASIKGSL